MKKFTQILSRRLARPTSSSSPSSTDVDPFSSFEVGCFHQLRSNRLKQGDIIQRSSPHPIISDFIADDSTLDDTCPTCKSIDFPRVLSWQPGDPRPWVPLSHCLLLEDEDEARFRCPYCAFFRAMLDAQRRDGRDESRKFAPYLRIRMAFERLGVGEKHDLAGSVVFEIMSRNKSLPEGYLIKAVVKQEEDDELLLLQQHRQQQQQEQEEEMRYNGSEKKKKKRKQKNKKNKKNKNVSISISGRIVGSDLDVKLPMTWIDFCNKNHKATSCSNPIGAGPLVEGLKLIDCETHLLVSKADIDADAAGLLEYVTLSSFWSPSEMEPLLQDNGKTLIKDLPMLIKDAISVTRQLGFRYLWVQGLCLSSTNDDDNHQPPKTQTTTTLIANIFAHSSLTIIVAAGHTIHDGIPGLSTPRQPQLSLKTQSALFTTTLIRPDLQVGSSVWASNGWTFQEGLLSRRRLVFTPSQVYFQCQTLHCHESLSLPLALAPAVTAGRIFPLSGAGTRPEHLSAHIDAYIGKELTDPHQRLDAFRGVLDHHFVNGDNDMMGGGGERGGGAVDSFLGMPLFHSGEFSDDSAVVVVSQTDRLAVALGWGPGSWCADRYKLAYGELFPSWSWLAWRMRTRQQQQQQQHRHERDQKAQAFSFALFGVGGAVATGKTRALEGVQAMPKLEVAVGLRHEGGGGGVLSWEVDSEAIKKREENVEFLRLTSFCFDITVVKEADDMSITPGMPLQTKEAVLSWFQSGYDSAGLLDSSSEPSTTSTTTTTNTTPTTSTTTIITTTLPESTPSLDQSSLAVSSSADNDNIPNGSYTLTGILLTGRNWKATSRGPKTASVMVCGLDAQGRMIRHGVIVVGYLDFKMAADEGSAVLGGVDVGAGERENLTVRLTDVDIY